MVRNHKYHICYWDFLVIYDREIITWRTARFFFFPNHVKSCKLYRYCISSKVIEMIWLFTLHMSGQGSNSISDSLTGKVNSEWKWVFGEKIEGDRIVMEHDKTITKASFRKRGLRATVKKTQPQWSSYKSFKG